MQHRITKILAAGCLAALCGNAFGSACTSDATLTGSTTGDTCTGTDQIVNACSDATPIGNAKDFIYSVNLSASSNATITFTVADSGQASGFRQFSAPLPVASGVNRIEFDLNGGATGSFRYWLSNETDVTADGTPTATVSPINTTAWSGVTQANLGVFAASTQYRGFFTASTHLYVDEFDSRRQTFIGK